MNETQGGLPPTSLDPHPLLPASAPPPPDLMHSLGRLVRGLSAIFWGLPAALVICVHTAKAEPLRTFGILPPVATTGLVLFGLWQLGAFQKQERVWRGALDRARILALINFGLSPFLYWSSRVPYNTFFSVMALLMAATGLLFLGSLNSVLKRLGAMLPDEALRLETRQFTAFNLRVLGAIALLGIAYLGGRQWRQPPIEVAIFLNVLERTDLGSWGLILMVLVPLAMTMALIWKTKEVIMESVFGPKAV